MNSWRDPFRNSYMAELNSWRDPFRNSYMAELNSWRDPFRNSYAAELNGWRDPFRNSYTAELNRMVNPIRELRPQMELTRDSVKGFHEHVAELNRMVNPIRELHTEKNYIDQIRHVVDDSRRFHVELGRAVNPIRDSRVHMDELRRLSDPVKDYRVRMDEMERVVNPIRELYTEKNYIDQIRHVVDDSRRFHVELGRAVNPIRELRVQMELAKDPFKEFRDQMGQFDKSIVNFTRIFDEIVESAIPFTSSRSVGIDVFIEPEFPEIGKQPVRIHYPDNSGRSFGEKVFIVCGGDEGAKQTLARWIEKLGLEAVIINEKPSGALTRIEKVERYTDDITFTVALLTPDDEGKPKSELGKSNSRASQDVILQLGLLIGKYGRDQICFLYKGELELPSSMNGINLIPMDANGGWVLNLIQEIEDAGLSIDINKAI